MNNYYVYQHLEDDGTIVYVGMGKYDRAWSTKRSTEHAEWMKLHLPDLKIKFHKKGLQQAVALEIELALIKKLQPKFNKKHCEEDHKRRVMHGKWLASEKSIFNDSIRQAELGIRAAASPNHPNNRLDGCKICGRVMNIGHIRRYHNDNCKAARV